MVAVGVREIRGVGEIGVVGIIEEELWGDLFRLKNSIIAKIRKHKSITVIKNFTGPFVTQFSAKAKEDFDDASKALGIERLFE